MNMSQEINHLALSLSGLQGEIKDVFKDKEGYGYYYADLASVLDTVRPLLTKYQLSVTQVPEFSDGKMGLTTVLMHSSGQWVSGTMHLQIEKLNKMTLTQSTGAIMTYARRYALAAIIGLAQTDNDASNENLNEEVEKKNNLVRRETLDNVMILCSELELGKETIEKFLEFFNVNAFSDLTENQAKKLILKFQKKIKEKEKLNENEKGEADNG